MEWDQTNTFIAEHTVDTTKQEQIPYSDAYEQALETFQVNKMTLRSPFTLKIETFLP